MPPRIVHNIDLSLLLREGEDLKTLKAESVGSFLLRWSRYSALRALESILDKGREDNKTAPETGVDVWTEENELKRRSSL